MLKRKYTDTDGMCFAEKSGCIAMQAYDIKNCGTYNCPFYKPAECEDWIKIEHKNFVELYTPEEYYSGCKQQR